MDPRSFDDVGVAVLSVLADDRKLIQQDRREGGIDMDDGVIFMP